MLTVSTGGSREGEVLRRKNEMMLRVLRVLAVLRGYVVQQYCETASTRSISGFCIADTPGTSRCPRFDTYCCGCLEYSRVSSCEVLQVTIILEIICIV